MHFSLMVSVISFALQNTFDYKSSRELFGCRFTFVCKRFVLCFFPFVPLRINSDYFGEKYPNSNFCCFRTQEGKKRFGILNGKNDILFFMIQYSVVSLSCPKIHLILRSVNQFFLLQECWNQ